MARDYDRLFNPRPPAGGVAEAPPHPVDGAEASLSPAEARIEALFDERLSSANRADFARQVAALEQDRAPGFAQEHFGRRLRFDGDIPPKIRQLLEGQLPPLTALAWQRGFRLRHPYPEVVLQSRARYEQERGPLPKGMRLPASTYARDAAGDFRIRVVLPTEVAGVEGVLTIMRAYLTRYCGDLLLRGEIMQGGAWLEDTPDAELSVGMAEQIHLLAQVPQTTAALETVLENYGNTIGVSHKRQPEQTRKAWFAQAAEDLQRGRLAESHEQLVGEVFDQYAGGLREDPAAALDALVESTVELNRQLHFMPPEDAPRHEKLRARQPLAWLRGAKVRMEFLCEALAGVVEDFEALEAGEGVSPLAQERVGGHIAQLEREGLARPYLVEGAQLSEELQRKRTAFPLEVHRLMAAFPPGEQGEKLFVSLKKRMESALHQRVYGALLLLRHWLNLHARGQGDTFAGGEAHTRLKGLVANFRFRLPLLRALFVRAGVVLDILEQTPARDTAGDEGADGDRRFPVDAFALAWGQFAAHALCAEFYATVKPIKGFATVRYWEGVTARLRGGLENPGHRLLLLLRLVQQGLEEEVGAGEQAAGEPLAAMVDMLRDAGGTFRFSVARALRPLPERRREEGWEGQLRAWTESILTARRNSRQNAIVVG